MRIVTILRICNTPDDACGIFQLGAAKPVVANQDEGEGGVAMMCGRVPAAPKSASRMSEPKKNEPKRKRTNFRWPSMGINYPANRPDPDGPGGLGAEESGTERTGPTQDCLVARQRGGRLAEVGQQYDCANVPVTPSGQYVAPRRCPGLGSNANGRIKPPLSPH